MSLHIHLSIISRENVPLLQLPLVPIGDDPQAEAIVGLLIASALEEVDVKLANASQLYLKQIDKLTTEWVASAFVTLGYTKFILVHPARIDEATLKLFFGEVHTAYVKAQMSPFSDLVLDANGSLTKTILESARKLYRYH